MFLTDKSPMNYEKFPSVCFLILCIYMSLFSASILNVLHCLNFWVCIWPKIERNFPNILERNESETRVLAPDTISNAPNEIYVRFETR